ncbi:hypothetical protein NQZ79_g2817 [Umbelopsis isabellina]|nr:hypothetical protein NQZ79_g2817 [Umbelopsis isabellina]
MNILSNLVPKFGLANSKIEETNVDSDSHEPPQDLSIVEAQHHGQSVGEGDTGNAPGHINIPPNDFNDTNSSGTPYSAYQTPSAATGLDSVSKSLEHTDSYPPGKRERPESQPSIDPLSAHIIRRVSYRVKPEDDDNPLASDIKPIPDSDNTEQDTLNETSDSTPTQTKPSDSQTKAGRIGRKKTEHKAIPELKAEEAAAENEDASSLSSTDGRNSIDSQRSAARSNVTSNNRTMSAAPHGLPIVKTRSKIKANRAFARMVFAQTLTAPRLDINATPTETNDAKLVPGINEDDYFSTEELVGAVWVLKFSKDGKYLAQGGQDCVLRVWQVLGQQANSTLAVPGEQNRNGEATNETIKVFEDKPLHEYEGHMADILDVSWSKNNFLLSSSMDKTVRLWHVTRKECLCVFQHLDVVTSITFHPRDDRFFLSGSLDCKLRLWNIPDKKVAYWNEVPDSNMVTAVGFTHNGKIAVAGSYVGSCFFYETEGLRYNTQINLTPSKGRNSKKARKITGIESMPGMPPGEEKLLITSNDSRIRLINLKDKGLVAKYKGLDNPSMQIRATFSDDGRQIICGSEDRNIFIWETEQAGFSPFHYLQDSRYKTAATLGHFGEQLVQTAVNSTHHNGQPTRVSGWLKRGGEKVKEKLKGGYEYFEGHNQVVTTAIFAPTRTRQILARSGFDTIYNNTIIPDEPKKSIGNRLVRSGSNASHVSTSQAELEAEQSEQSRQRALNYTYPDGHIIVSADNVGVIKVWRVDCGNYGAGSNLLSPTTSKQEPVVGSSVHLHSVPSNDSTIKPNKAKRNIASMFGKSK